MRSMRRLPHILYTWVVVGLGFWLLAHTFPLLDLDHGRELLLLVALAVLAEWLAVTLPHGQLSGGFAIIFSTFLVFGPVAAAWISGLASLIGQGVMNRGNPMRTTLFNAAQYVLVALGANFLYRLAGGSPGRELSLGNALPFVVFVLAYYVLNHSMVYIYTLQSRQGGELFRWADALRWDGLTYLLAVPFGLLMAMLYSKIEIYGMGLLFLPVLVIQFMLRVYIKQELVNRELRVLYEVARRLGGSLKLDEILELVLRETRRVINFHTGVIYLRSDSDDDLFRAGVAAGPHARLLRESTVRRGEGFLGLAVESGEPQIVHDTRIDVRTAGDVGLAQVHRSLLVVPLVAETEVLGLLVLGDKRPGFFEDKHLQTMSIIGGQTAVAIANVQLYRKLELATITDGLTGLYNYRYFYSRLMDELHRSARYGASLSLVMLDVDHFKKINDHYGHLAGDTVLARVADIIEGGVRGCDLVARYGGEEFAVVMPQTGPSEALHVAERIRLAVREAPFEYEGERFQIRISAGVATYPVHAENLKELLEAADAALYRAKDEGRDRSRLFAEGVSEGRFL